MSLTCKIAIIFTMHVGLCELFLRRMVRNSGSQFSDYISDAITILHHGSIIDHRNEIKFRSHYEAR